MNFSFENDCLKIACESAGGQLTSIQDKTGTEYLWQGDPAYWASRAPLLFPIVGSLRDKKAAIGKNKTCCMERHGLVRHMEFEKVSETPHSVTLRTCSNEETLKRYPFNFEFFVEYSLNGNTLTNRFTVVNKNNETMPFQIGGHPAFRCPVQAGETFEDYIVRFEQPETADCPTPIPATGLADLDARTRILDNTDTLALRHELFSVDALIFDKLKSRSAKLIHKTTGKGIQIDFPQFKNLLVWSSNNNAPFVALEPWSGLTTCNQESDIFEEKQGVILLPANEKTSISFDITVLS